jgi:hypothetical protein
MSNVIDDTVYNVEAAEFDENGEMDLSTFSEEELAEEF